MNNNQKRYQLVQKLFKAENMQEVDAINKRLNALDDQELYIYKNKALKKAKFEQKINNLKILAIFVLILYGLLHITKIYLTKIFN